MHSQAPAQRQVWMANSANEFCQMCRSFLSFVARQQTRTEATMEFHNIRQLKVSSENGCHMCTLIMSCIKPKDQRKYLEELDRASESEPQFIAVVWFFAFPPPDPQATPYFRIEEAKPRPPACNRVVICKLQCEVLTDVLQTTRLLKRVPPSTGSFETLNTIHHWLRECNMAHMRCAQRARERLRQTPTRLLQLQAFDPSPKVYLRQTAQIPADATYATLSHCWGQYMPVKLERSTLQAFLSGIDIDKLPLTYQHAITLTRSLGIEYIWIDSLCIIQDDGDDWANECTRMTSVYMNSFINIGANAANDSRGGLFQQRSWKSVNPLPVHLTYTPAKWHRKPVVLWPRPEVGNVLDDTPLGGRAWVVQERLLAPRTVHFLKHKVVWECDECEASETDVTGKLEETAFSKRTHLAIPTAPRNSPDDPTTQFLAIWRDIIDFYSSGKLSFVTDKLVAISGVAKYMFEKRQNDKSLRYYAGHWSRDFELQLMWITDPSSAGSRPQTYVAPSWSWASFDGHIIPTRWGSRTLWATLVHANVHPVSDSFGAVSSGFIRMKGRLCRAVLTHRSFSSDEEGGPSLILLGSGVHVRFSPLYWDEKAKEMASINDDQNPVVLLGVAQSDDIDGKPLQGLLLRLTGQENGQYRRVGYFSIYDEIARSFKEHRKKEFIWAASGGVYEEPEEDQFGALCDALEALDMPALFYERIVDNQYEFTIV